MLGTVDGKRVKLTKAGKAFLGQRLGWYVLESLRGAARYLAAESAAVSCTTDYGFLVSK